MKKIKLSEIIGGMDFGAEESGYLNKKTYQVVMINEDDLRTAEDAQPLEDLPDWQQEVIKEAQTFLMHKEDFLALPARQEIHEYNIMQEFCRSVPNEQMSVALSRHSRQAHSGGLRIFFPNMVLSTSGTAIATGRSKKSRSNGAQPTRSIT